MLPRCHRLRRPSEFQRVYRRGRAWSTPLVTLHVAPAAEGRRVGISVSKKVGGAVVRNRVRRQLREALRAELPGWRRGCEVIVVARAAAATASWTELRAALRTLALRAGLPADPDSSEAACALPPGERRARSAGGVASC